jgi:hypothetical protein
VEAAIEIDLNVPASIDYESSLEASDSDGKFQDESGATKDVEIVLALQAKNVDYTMEEIQPRELLSSNPSADSLVG